MGTNERVSTGLKGFDAAIDMLRLGDNVVWQVDTISDYMHLVTPFVRQAREDGRNLIYIRFGQHDALLDDMYGIRVYYVDAAQGFESFATKIHNIVKDEGRKAFYVFDCLTDLLKFWHSDLMIGNFFRVTCPFLYDLDTVAYFALKRNSHTYDTIARIRETTQVLLDLYRVKENYYIHPLKVWERYAPTMFFPHLIDGQEAVCITSSADAAALFSGYTWNEERLDYWAVTLQNARNALSGPPALQEEKKKLLLSLLIGEDSKMYDLCYQYFSLTSLLRIAAKEIGTGFIGGKSVGMLLARKILKVEDPQRFMHLMEPHDSYYIGSDIFYTYIVQNNCWDLRMRQKTQEGYFCCAGELKEKLLNGKFPRHIQEQFMHMLEYFGQSPIIVRSSSLLEDNFGNAFAGKYESVFCVNQGTPDERYEAFENAVRKVYASTMNEDALSYRINRGLVDLDEQMAILIQRVSGDYYGDNFFPHIAGVGNSSNLYVWNKDIDMSAGMLRLVFGLGTRAVDRISGDYPRIVCLDNPLQAPLVAYGDQQKFSQHRVDLLDLRQNILTDKAADDILPGGIRTDFRLFADPDTLTMNRLRDLGYRDRKTPYILSFQNLFKKTGFAETMRDMLALLSEKYDYPVDIEFTANFTEDGSYLVNLLQCRPLQTKGLGQPVSLPSLDDPKSFLFYSKGNFMGGNVRLPIDYVVFVDAKAYLKLPEQEKYSVARQIGSINSALKGRNAMLIGPGRWGTTTPSLGVPVHFTEICNMAAICEVAYQEEGLMPELSYGSHFFQDLVESDIFYTALFYGDKDVIFNPALITDHENVLADIIPSTPILNDVIHVIETKGMELYSDIITQTVLCKQPVCCDSLG